MILQGLSERSVVGVESLYKPMMRESSENSKKKTNESNLYNDLRPKYRDNQCRCASSSI